MRYTKSGKPIAAGYEEIRAQIEATGVPYSELEVFWTANGHTDEGGAGFLAIFKKDGEEAFRTHVHDDIVALQEEIRRAVDPSQVIEPAPGPVGAPLTADDEGPVSGA
jgi:hypothetical protein